MSQTVAYYRVSTKQQHRSGLGIEAQRATVTRFAEAEKITVIAEYVEAETGKGADALERRPQLAAALAAARKARCCVVVSKLDRLSRDVAFVSGLMAQRPARADRHSIRNPFSPRSARVAASVATAGTTSSFRRETRRTRSFTFKKAR
jgi:DNA invertase Pin-like site-specific DNA recombinase